MGRERHPTRPECGHPCRSGPPGPHRPISEAGRDCPVQPTGPSTGRRETVHLTGSAGRRQRLVFRGRRRGSASPVRGLAAQGGGPWDERRRPRVPAGALAPVKPVCGDGQGPRDGPTSGKSAGPPEMQERDALAEIHESWRYVASRLATVASPRRGAERSGRQPIATLLGTVSRWTITVVPVLLGASPVGPRPRRPEGDVGRSRRSHTTSRSWSTRAL
jgi:hypothetical protein